MTLANVPCCGQAATRSVLHIEVRNYMVRLKRLSALLWGLGAYGAISSELCILDS